MTQHAIAVPAALPCLDETIATIAAAGRLIAELKARLDAADRRIATLQGDKRDLEDALRAVRGPQPLGLRGDDRGAPSFHRSHVDDALAAIARGLGPSVVRVP